MNFEELTRAVFDAGVVGAGGAGFPTHKKLAQGIDTLIVNAAECEPLLEVDKFILRDNIGLLEDTLKILIDALGAERAYIGVKEKNAENLKTKSSKVSIKIIPDIYPAGDEVVLTYEVTGRIIPEGSLPLNVGVVVLNVETLFNIAGAVSGKPVTLKRVAVAGAVPRTVSAVVPVGTPLGVILEKAGITDLSGLAVIDGGPLMGRLLESPLSEVVTKTTKGVLVLPENHYLIRKRKQSVNVSLNRAASNCCQCRMCTDMCPRYLLGYDFEIHKTVRAAANRTAVDVKAFTQSFLCCSCGICDYISCTQDICPRAVAGAIKGELAKNGVRRTAEPHEMKADKARAGRLVPSSRIRQRTGIEKYYTHAEYIGEVKGVTHVELPLRQHIGKPAEPLVKVGDTVKAGQLIASVNLSDVGANIHASIAGKVTGVSDRIIIEK